MIRTWPGQTYEEWLKERERDAALTPEERDREMDEYIKQIDEKWEKINSENKQKQTTQTPEDFFKNCDHPNSLDNIEATILWIVVMAIASIFNSNWIIWIIATIIWRKYITRHKIKK
jgi:hypothetical protein